MPLHPSNNVSTGMQMLTGAVVQLALGLIAGERVEPARVTEASMWAILYLSIFGSLIGFTAYGWLLRVEPPSRVSTYAYVNPVVAVLLGAALGGEPLTAKVGVAAAVIIAGVVLIVTGRKA